MPHILPSSKCVVKLKERWLRCTYVWCSPLMHFEMRSAYLGLGHLLICRTLPRGGDGIVALTLAQHQRMLQHADGGLVSTFYLLRLLTHVRRCGTENRFVRLLPVLTVNVPSYAPVRRYNISCEMRFESHSQRISANDRFDSIDTLWPSESPQSVRGVDVKWSAARR